MTPPHWLNLRDSIAILGEILAESGGQSGILNQSALDSTLAKPQNLYYYSDGQATLYQLAASQQNPETDLEQLAQWLQTHSQQLTDTP